MASVRLFAAIGGVFRHDEPEATRIGLQPADDEIHLLRQPVPVAADLQQFPAGDERFQLSLERLAFVTRNAEHLRELPCRGRMRNALADEAEEIA
jgi:hypothetical protein